MTIPIKANRAYPSLPAPGSSLEAHTRLLEALKEAVEIHERRIPNAYLDSFVRLRELIELGIMQARGNQIVLSLDAVLPSNVALYDGDVSQFSNGTFADGRIAESNVTQHQAALVIDWSQLTSVPSIFPPGSHTHSASDITTGTLSDARLSSNVALYDGDVGQFTSGTFDDARIAESNVTQHQAALSISWSQLTDVPPIVLESRKIDTGTGLTGGGDLSQDRTIALDATTQSALALATSAVQPGDLAAVATSGDFGDLSDVPAMVSSLGALSDPDADRIVFWDDSADALAFLEIGTGLEISGTSLQLTSAAQNALTLAATALQPGDNISDLTNDTGYITGIGGFSIGDLADVNIGTPGSGEDGYALVWDNDEGEFVLAPVSGGGGTVTSVAVSVPTGFTVTGSPITSSGTIEIEYDTGYQGFTSAEAALIASAVQPGDLAAVAFSGDYGDLSNTPTIPPDVSAATFITASDETSTLSNSRQLVAGANITLDTSTPGQIVINSSASGGGGQVDEVIGTAGQIDVDNSDPAKPVLSLHSNVLAALGLAGTAVQPGDLADVAFSGDYGDLINVPSTFPPAAHTHNASDINAGTLADARLPSIVARRNAFNAFSGIVVSEEGFELRNDTLDARLRINITTGGRIYFAPWYNGAYNFSREFGFDPAVEKWYAEGGLTDASITQSSVKQHEAALSIGWAQLTGLPDYATRWPSWSEVTDKPSTFPPSSHTHSAEDITSGTLAEARLSSNVALLNRTPQTFTGINIFRSAPNVYGAVEVGASANISLQLGSYDTASTDIVSVVNQTTSSGGLIRGASQGHLVLALRDNDTTDSVSIISGGGNYTSDTTYDTLVAQFLANGNTRIGGTLAWGGGDAIASSSLVPLKNAPNVFDGGDGTYTNARIKIEASSIATLGFRDTSGPGTDEGITVFRQQNNQFSVRSRNDADNDGAILWHGTRSGTSWSEFEVNATLLDFNGNADISGTLAVGGAATFSNNVTVGGTISGNGSGLTSLNASNLSSGTVPSDRLPSTIGGNKTFSNNVTVGGTISGNGSGLTNLNASNLSSGTVPDARLSPNVMLTGAYGLGSQNLPSSVDMNFVNTTQFNAQFTSPSGPGGQGWAYLTLARSTTRVAQIAVRTDIADRTTGNLIAVRHSEDASNGLWYPWRFLWHTGNFDPNTKADVDSGSFTATLTGVSGTVQGTIDWYRVGRLVTLYSANNITGTANAIGMSLQQLPASLRPTQTRDVPSIGMVANNAAGRVGRATVLTNGGISFAYLETGGVLVVFPNTGAKGLEAGWSITYLL